VRRGGGVLAPVPPCWPPLSPGTLFFLSVIAGIDVGGNEEHRAAECGTKDVSGSAIATVPCLAWPLCASHPFVTDTLASCGR
jgi:hypothetical protein